MHPGGGVKESVERLRGCKTPTTPLFPISFIIRVRLDGVEDRGLYFEKAMPHTSRGLILLVATGLLVLIGPLVGAQSVEQAMVVTVLDRDGSPVEGLEPDDFVVYEDDALREVVRVSRDTEPRQIALLVDTSEAASRAIADFRNGVSTFIDEIDGGHDIALISFGGRPRILMASTREPTRLQKGVGQIFSETTTAAYLLDALRETTEGFVKRGATRPVIVVLTTEGLDYSHIDSRTVLRGLEEAAVAVHTVVLIDRGFAPHSFGSSGVGDLDNGPLAQWRTERDRGLNHAPSISGGSRRDLLTSMSATQAMSEVADELRSQYLIVYSSPDTLVPPQNRDVGLALDDGLTVRQTPVRATR